MNLINNTLVVIIFCVMAAAGISAAIAISSNLVQGQHVARYDCGMAEWHPDVPREVREQCRNKRTAQ